MHTYGCLHHQVKVEDADKAEAWRQMFEHQRAYRAGYVRKHSTCRIEYALVEHVHRRCNGCERDLGDLTAWEVRAAHYGLPLPDVRDECPNCSTEASPDDGISDRPREGVIEHVFEVDGETVVYDVTSIRFIEGGASGMFKPVLPDGSPVKVQPGDRIVADMLGPGQTIKITVDTEEPPNG